MDNSIYEVNKTYDPKQTLMIILSATKDRGGGFDRVDIDVYIYTSMMGY